MAWKKGRGKLGLFAPLLGVWQAEASSEKGAVTCTREIKKILSGKYLQLHVRWEYADKTYEEQAMIGVNPDKEVCFWSFTSDGKQSIGKLADVTDIHPDAIGFEAEISLRDLRNSVTGGCRQPGPGTYGDQRRESAV